MERPCLKCQQPFDSAGKHNRICPACGKENRRLERVETRLGRRTTTPRNGKHWNQDSSSGEH